MRNALIIAAGLLFIGIPAWAQERERPTVEIMIGPHFGSGEIREFDDPVTFEQDVDYDGYFLKTGLDLPLKSRTTLLFRAGYDHLESDGDFLFPLVDEFELRRERDLFTFGFGVRFKLR